MVYPALLFVLGIALLYMAIREVPFVSNGYFVLLVASPLFFLLIVKAFRWAGGGGGGGMGLAGGVIAGMIVAVLSLPAAWYFGVLAGAALFQGIDFFSLAGLRVKKTFDLADGAIHRHDYDEAERLYREALVDHGSNVELRRRLVSLYVTTRRFDEALAELREVGRLSKRADDIYIAAFERADILADEKKDIAAAIEEISAVLERFSESASASFAHERLAQLEKRLEG